MITAPAKKEEMIGGTIAAMTEDTNTTGEEVVQETGNGILLKTDAERSFKGTEVITAEKVLKAKRVRVNSTSLILTLEPTRLL